MPQARNLVEVQPAGMVAFFANSSVPSGWLACNGAAVSRTTYSDLFAAIGGTYGAGDGSTTFNLPDLRGEFVRGLDSGRGVDSGRGIGTFQSDAFQGHFHNSVGTTVGQLGGGSQNIPRTNPADGPLNGSAASSIRGPSDDGANGAPRTSAETRPRNRALLACIKF